MVKSYTCTGPYGSWNLRLPEFLHNRHRKAIRLSVLHTGHLYSQVGFLVLISAGSWVNARAITRTGVWSQWRIAVTSSGIEPATFRRSASTSCTTEYPLTHVEHRYLKNYKEKQFITLGSAISTSELILCLQWMNMIVNNFSEWKNKFATPTKVGE